MFLKHTCVAAALAVVCLVTVGDRLQATAQAPPAPAVTTPSQTNAGDLMLAGNEVRVRGEALEDVVAAGNDVTISGPVRGYVLAAGRNVVVDGSIGNDLYAAAATLTLDAPVADNAVLAGGEVYLRPDAVVQHDVVATGGTVRIEGTMLRDLKLAAGNATLASEVGGSVEARVGQLTVLPTAVVRGDLKVYSTTPPQIAPEAQVLGRIEHIPVDEAGWAASWFRRWGYSFLALSLVGLVAVGLSSLWTGRVAAAVTDRPGTTLLTGLAGLVLIPILAVLLMITVIGIPLAMMVLALFAVALLLSGVFASWLAGGWLLARLGRPDASRWGRILVGALAVSLLVSVPWLGTIVGFLILLAGLGALLIERRASWRQARPQVPAAP